jgi:group I intron endonuclease
MGYIYILTSPSGKSYIGQTSRPIQKRFEEHKLESSGCVAISNAVKKYGWDNLVKDWYECPDGELNKHEELMIEVLGTLSPGGYNLKEGGANGKPSAETKQKMSEAQKGDKGYWYGKNGEKHHMYGKAHTEETKKKIGEAQRVDKHHMYGKAHTEETKQKMSESARGEKNHNSKRVYQYDLDGNLLGTFASNGEAVICLKKKNSSLISACARGIYKTAYGFKWSYTYLV